MSYFDTFDRRVEPLREDGYTQELRASGTIPSVRRNSE